MRIRPTTRRQFLRMTAALSTATAFGQLSEALAAGTEELGVHSVKGKVYVNGVAARQGTSEP